MHLGKESLQLRLIQDLRLDQARGLADLAFDALIAYQGRHVVDLPLSAVDVLGLFPPGDKISNCTTVNLSCILARTSICLQPRQWLQLAHRERQRQH